MKKYICLIFALSGLVLAEVDAKKTGLEKMIQPKVSYESSYLSDALIEGYEGN